MKAGDSSFLFILHPSSFILSGRRSQVVRQRSAKPLFIGSIPIAASNLLNNLETLTSSVKRSNCSLKNVGLELMTEGNGFERRVTVDTKKLLIILYY